MRALLEGRWHLPAGAAMLIVGVALQVDIVVWSVSVVLIVLGVVVGAVGLINMMSDRRRGDFDDL